MPSLEKQDDSESTVDNLIILDEKIAKTGKDTDKHFIGAQMLIASVNQDIGLSTSEYTYKVAKDGISSLLKVTAISCFSSATASILGPFGIIGIAGAAIISLAAGSAFVVGISMHDEKQAIKAKEKKESKTKQLLTALDGKDIEFGQDLEGIKKDVTEKQSRLAEQSEEITQQKNSRKKEFFARTAKLFGASLGIFVVSTVSAVTPVVAGAILTPLIGVANAVMMGACLGAMVGFTCKVAISAIAHGVNKILINNDIIAKPVELGKVITLEKISEYEKAADIVKKHESTIKEKDGIIANQAKELENLKKQFDDMKKQMEQISGLSNLDMNDTPKTSTASTHVDILEKKRSAAETNISERIV